MYRNINGETVSGNVIFNVWANEYIETLDDNGKKNLQKKVIILLDLTLMQTSLMRAHHLANVMEELDIKSLA